MDAKYHSAWEIIAHLFKAIIAKVNYSSIVTLGIIHFQIFIQLGE
jgi:hypothetical protein